MADFLGGHRLAPAEHGPLIARCAPKCLPA